MEEVKEIDPEKLEWGLPTFKLSPEQEAEIKQAFDIFDSKHTGFIEIRKMPLAVYYLGLVSTSDEIRHLMVEIDKEKSGRIAFKDFLEFMRQKMSETGTLQDFIKAFSYFDFENTGKVSFDNFKRAARDLNVNLTDEELKEMMETVDFDGDGAMSWEDLLGVLKENKLIE